MTYPRRLLLFAAVFGFIAVVMGTLAEHVFRASVDEEQFRYLMTAVRYLQVHSAVLLALALALLTGALSNQAKTGLRYSFVWLITGRVLPRFTGHFKEGRKWP